MDSSDKKEKEFSDALKGVKIEERTKKNLQIEIPVDENNEL